MPSLQAKAIAGLVLLLIITGLAGTVYYYKSQVETLQGRVALEQAKNTGLIKQIKDTKAEVDGYVKALTEITRDNANKSLELQKMRNKLASHKLVKMRNSRHSELVLKTINRSVAKSQEEWQK